MYILSWAFFHRAPFIRNMAVSMKSPVPSSRPITSPPRFQSSGFFRGLSIPIVSYGVISSTYFGVYGAALRQLREETGTANTYTHIALASGVAAGVCLVVGTPVDVIKVTMQSQVGNKCKWSVP